MNTTTQTPANHLATEMIRGVADRLTEAQASALFLGDGLGRACSQRTVGKRLLSNLVAKGLATPGGSLTDLGRAVASEVQS